MEIYDIVKTFKTYQDKFSLLTNKLDVKRLEEEFKRLEAIEQQPNFWDDNNYATKVIKEKQLIQNNLEIYQNNLNLFEEFELALEFFNNNELSEEEVNIEFEKLEASFKQFEMITLLSEKYDHEDAYLEIHPGAGGTESQDWADMVFRMYERYLNKHNYKVNVIDLQKAEVGLKSVLIEIKGNDAYGMLKGENGIHRLVRISPFDANKKRHTSFCSVKVMPVLSSDDNIEIDESELKIDRYRSSGAGGQSVNTTDSAIRITHLPTGIVVTCQNERSQIQNKEQALKILKSKLIEIKLQEQQAIKDELNTNNQEIGWGSQKRSYVLHPYKMIKDNISGYETSQANKVLDGDIEELLYYNLVPIK